MLLVYRWIVLVRDGMSSWDMGLRLLASITSLTLVGMLPSA